MRFACALGLAGAVGLGLSATTLSAQNADSLRALYTLEMPPMTYTAATASRTAPGSSASSPSAYGANWGSGFVGVGGQARTRYTPTQLPDGSAVVGFGLGNARDFLGLEVAMTSLSTFRQGFGTNYAASFKVHRSLPKNMGFAVGWENAVHNAGTDGGRSLYGVISSVIPVRSKATDPLSTLTVSIGVGNGRFRSEKDVQADEEAINVFGSAGLRVFEWVSVIADWTGQDLVAALSIVPFIRVPLIITPGFADLTGSAGDGARFVIGAGLGFRFRGLGNRSTRPNPPPGSSDAPPVARQPVSTAPAMPAPRQAPPAAESVPFDTALLTTRIHFDFDSSSLRPGAREALDAKIPLFLAYPNLAVRIEGHADERGVDEYNIALGQRRAVSARAYLVGSGVLPERIYLVSFGEERPLCTESTEECWRRNRRAEFKILVGPQ